MTQNEQNTSLGFLTKTNFTKSVNEYNGWGKFLAIVMYIYSGMMITGALVYLILAIILAFVPEGGWVLALFLALYCTFIVFFVVGLVFIGIKLWKSTEIVKSFNNSVSVEDYIQKSISNIALLRSYFKYQGILVISYFIFIIIISLFMVFIMVFSIILFEDSSRPDTYLKEWSFDNRIIAS